MSETATGTAEASAPFIVAGEALVDIVVPPGKPATNWPGGSPLNVAVGMSRLGINTVLVTELGEDELGSLVVAHVEDSGVALHERAIRPGFTTSTATARLDENNAATYEFDLRWTLPRHDFPVSARGLHVGSIGAAMRPGRDSVLDLVTQASDRGLLVTFDPNARPSLTPDAEQAWADVQETAAHSRLVKMSDEDLEFFQPGSTPEAVARHLLATGTTRLVVVTLGGAGAVGFSNSAAVEVKSRPTEVVDTVGAGDSFMAGLVTVALEHGALEPGHDDLDESLLGAYLEAAHQCASITVSRRGANPPTRAELAEDWPGLGSS